MKPRQYQTQAVIDARNSLKKGNKDICICLSVGSGKSLIAKMIMELAKGKVMGFFSHRTILIEQMETYFKDLDGYDIDFGTIQKFGKEKTKLYDLVIKDESYGHNSKLRKNINAKFMITLSGTPIEDDGTPLKFDDIVSGVQLPELVNQGYAKQIKVLSMSKIDTSNLKKQGNDYNKKQAFDIMDKSNIKKDIVSVYKQYANDRKTIIFAVDTQHCENLKKEFTENNIISEVIHSKQNKKLNSEALELFKNDEIQILISVDMLSIGVDIPSVNCVLFARPMRSIPLFIQCIGRATRINPLKPNDNALIIDCGDVLKNTSHHPMQMLDFKKTKQTKKQKECKNCKSPLTVLSKKNKMIDEVTYIQTTIYKCNSCNQYETVEEMKVVNLKFCESCEEQLTSKKITFKETPKELSFFIECECGFENVEKSIKLTDKQLKEIEYNETMQGENSWEKIRLLLKEECKKWNYNHRYTDRIIDNLKMRELEVDYIIDNIERIKANNIKISALNYI
jgi:superfamily II DNA or RNA helicase